MFRAKYLMFHKCFGQKHLSLLMFHQFIVNLFIRSICCVCFNVRCVILTQLQMALVASGQIFVTSAAGG